MLPEGVKIFYKMQRPHVFQNVKSLINIVNKFLALNSL
jgi:hypothetical protein